MDLRSAPELLTPDEVAEILRVPKSTVLYWARVGELIGVHFGKHVRFPVGPIRKRVEAAEQSARAAS